MVLRVDSPGGDALASDLMWREIRQLAAKKPVVACMADVAASGGYYMSMAAQVRVGIASWACNAAGCCAWRWRCWQRCQASCVAATSCAHRSAQAA